MSTKRPVNSAEYGQPNSIFSLSSLLLIIIIVMDSKWSRYSNMRSSFFPSSTSHFAFAFADGLSLQLSLIRVLPRITMLTSQKALSEIGIIYRLGFTIRFNFNENQRFGSLTRALCIIQCVSFVVYK